MGDLSRNTYYDNTISYSIKEYEQLKSYPEETVIRVFKDDKYIGYSTVGYVVHNAKDRKADDGLSVKVSNFMMAKKKYSKRRW